MTYRKEQAILEKIRLEYFANQYKPTFDMSYSPKLIKKYNLPSTIISVDRCLSPQQPFEVKNLRRLHQLYLNIGRYEYVHYVTLFNLDFLRVLLRCGEYKVNNLLYEFTSMNYDGSGDSRFLLKQFEISLDLLNQYPANLAFELVYRLFPFRKQLSELLFKLLEQSLMECPLLLITDDQRPQYLYKCSMSKIIYSKISSFSLFVVTEDKKIYQFSNHFETTVRQSDIPYKKKENFISGLYENDCLCCMTSNLQMIAMKNSTKEITMQIPCNQV